MTKPVIERIEVSRDELNQLLVRAKTALNEDDYRKLKATVDALSYLTELVADRETTIRDLRQLLLPPSTEKTREVLKQAGIAPRRTPVRHRECQHHRPTEAQTRSPDTGATEPMPTRERGESKSHMRSCR
jgi:hypothetical protein